ncbi:hypothetical protein C8J57DRAFT_1712346 [Mycena rebaudengoi]|nr:hypothetical protein C8J57DRAFT_1712346 [Mycena rebaudengoi]
MADDPLKIPELLREIATHLQDPLDVSRLSQSNRFICQVVGPLLFTDIHVSLKSLPRLAERLGDNPEFAKECKSLFIHPPRLGSDHYTSQYSSSGFPRSSLATPSVLSSSLHLILQEISQHGRLERFGWTPLAARIVGYQAFQVDAGFWTALASAGSRLEELNLEILPSCDHEGFAILANADFPVLRILRLTINGEYNHLLRRLLQKLPLLRFLDLRLSGQDVDLTSTHTHLISLTLRYHSYHDGSDILRRYPSIEILHLDASPSSMPLLCDDLCLPRLKALSITSTVILSSGVIVLERRQIKQLRLIDMAVFSRPMVRRRLHRLSATLTCLEMDWDVRTHFQSWLEEVSLFLQLAPLLLEFGIIAKSPRVGASFNATDLPDFLAILDDSVRLQAVRFFDSHKGGSALPSSLLENVGHVPPSLQYIKWDVDSCTETYCLERRDDRVVATVMARPVVYKPQLDWTAESILDHLS